MLHNSDSSDNNCNNYYKKHTNNAKTPRNAKDSVRLSLITFISYFSQIRFGHGQVSFILLLIIKDNKRNKIIKINKSKKRDRI